MSPWPHGATSGPKRTSLCRRMPPAPGSQAGAVSSAPSPGRGPPRVTEPTYQARREREEPRGDVAATGKGQQELWDSRPVVDRCVHWAGAYRPCPRAQGALACPRGSVYTGEPSCSGLGAPSRPPSPTSSLYLSRPHGSIQGHPHPLQTWGTTLSATCRPTPQRSSLDADPRTCNNNDSFYNHCSSQ